VNRAIIILLLLYTIAAPEASASERCFVCKCLQEYGALVFSGVERPINVERLDDDIPGCSIASLAPEQRSESPFILLGNAIRKRMAKAGATATQACRVQWRFLVEALRKGDSDVCTIPPGKEKRSAFTRETVGRCNEDQFVTTEIYSNPGTFASDEGQACSDWPQPLAAQFLVVGRMDNAHFLQANGFPSNWDALIRETPALDRVLWLLVQHADNTPAFQTASLDRYSALLKDGLGNPETWARLSDRVALNQEKKQRYGTHFSCVDGKAVPSPLLEPEMVDEERARLGLPPLEEFLAEITREQCSESEEN